MFGHIDQLLVVIWMLKLCAGTQIIYLLFIVAMAIIKYATLFTVNWLEGNIETNINANANEKQKMYAQIYEWDEATWTTTTIIITVRNTEQVAGNARNEHIDV